MSNLLAIVRYKELSTHTILYHLLIQKRQPYRKVGTQSCESKG
jgi:hypothetical protein